jgi:hypothetical protein
MYEEYIIGTSIQADSAPIYEDWETPTQLMWKDSRWTCCTATVLLKTVSMVSCAQRNSPQDRNLGYDDEQST